jgi:hypothetical protein
MNSTAVHSARMGETKTPYIAAADGALRAAGWWNDGTWMLLGLSGFGFHVVADRGTCPSSPTAYDWSTLHREAAARIGIDSMCVECVGDMGTFDERQAEAISLIKQSLDRGVPAVIRTLDYAEFAIVTGYDDEGQIFHVMDITGDPDPILYGNLGKPHGSPMLFVQVFTARREFDLEEAARASLDHGLRSWNAKGWEVSYGSGYRVGRDGYETLIEAVENADSDPLGLRYVLRILADARAGLSRYMNRLRDDRVLREIDSVAETYAHVVPLLKRVSELLPAKEPWERPLDPAILPEASRLLRSARDLEDAAMRDIEQLAPEFPRDRSKA